MADSKEGEDQASRSPREAIEDLERRLEVLKNRLQFARGTADVTGQALEALGETSEVAAPHHVVSLRDRVEVALRAQALDAQQLALRLGEAVGRVSDILRLLLRSGRLANIGLEDRPLWIYRVGEEATTIELEEVVRRLISTQPMTSRQLAGATGVRVARIGAVIVDIRRGGARVMNLSKTHVHKWFIMPETDKVTRPRARRTRNETSR